MRTVQCTAWVFQGYISTGAVFPSFVRCPCSTRKPLVRLSSYTAFWSFHWLRTVRSSCVFIYYYLRWEWLKHKKHKKFKTDNVMQCVTSLFLGDADIVTIDASNGKVIKLFIITFWPRFVFARARTSGASRSGSMKAEMKVDQIEGKNEMSCFFNSYDIFHTLGFWLLLEPKILQGLLDILYCRELLQMFRISVNKVFE